MNKMTRRGNYVCLPREYARALGLVGCAIVMNVISAGQSAASPDGYMQCTPAFLCHGLGLSEEAERVAVNVLREKGIVETTTHGGSRHIRVDLDRLARVVERGDC
jgi:hypothetical protein